MSHTINAPTYILRAGFSVASHGELAANYTHAQLSRSFHFREMAAGAVDGNDVLQVDFTRDIGDVFQRMSVGQATFFLDNPTGAYSPASRAAFIPGKIVSFKAKRADISLGETVPRVEPLFSGTIIGYQVTPELGKRVVRLEAEDRGGLLRRKINLPMKLNTKTASLALDLMQATGIKPRDRSVDSNATDDISFSLIDDMTAGEALDRLIKSGGHYAFVDGKGVLTFKDRNFEFRTAAVATLNEFDGLGYDLPWDRVINDVRITSAPRAVATEPQTVAFLDEAPAVPGSGGALAFFVAWRDVEANEQGVPVTSATTPVSSLDWKLNTQPDGAGSDLTSGAALAMVPFARSGLVTVVNSNTQAGFLSRFNVRGYPVKAVPPFSTFSQNSASITTFGRRDLEIETELIKTLAFGQAYGDLLLSKRKDATPTIEISLRNKWPQILFIDLSKRIIVTEDITGINTAWTVRGIEHSISTDPGPSHTARYRLEAAESRTYFVLDRDPEGKLDADRVLAP